MAPLPHPSDPLRFEGPFFDAESLRDTGVAAGPMPTVEFARDEVAAQVTAALRATLEKTTLAERLRCR